MGTSLTRNCVDNTQLYNTYSKVGLYSGFIRVLQLGGGSHSGFSLSYRHVPSSEITQLELNSVYVNGKKIDYDTRPWFQ